MSKELTVRLLQEVLKVVFQTGSLLGYTKSDIPNNINKFFQLRFEGILLQFILNFRPALVESSNILKASYVPKCKTEHQHSLAASRLLHIIYCNNIVCFCLY